MDDDNVGEERMKEGLCPACGEAKLQTRATPYGEQEGYCPLCGWST
jgi:predicted RNA-binding Zn-ribbon protein involved in translation (DUF1610 family)